MSKLHDGMRFGPFGRYMLRFHKSEREGVESMWIVLDAETPDELTGRPGIVRQDYTPEGAVRGLGAEYPHCVQCDGPLTTFAQETSGVCTPCYEYAVDSVRAVVAA